MSLYAGSSIIDESPATVTRFTGFVDVNGFTNARDDVRHPSPPLIQGVILAAGKVWVRSGAAKVETVPGSNTKILFSAEHNGRNVVVQFYTTLPVETFGSGDSLRATRVLRWRNSTGAWVVADCAVRGEAMPIVADSVVESSTARSVLWRVRLRDGSTHALRADPTEAAAWWEVTSGGLAVWPARPHASFRFRSVLVGFDDEGDFDNLGLQPEFLDETGSPLVPRGQSAGIFNFDGTVPRWLVVRPAASDVDGAGSFSMRSTQLLDADAPSQLALDFGTSTTVLAGDGVVDFANAAQNLRVLVSNDARGCRTREPWVLGVPHQADNCDAFTGEVASGVYVKSDGDAPLLNLGLCMASVRTASLPSPAAWRAPLKFGADADTVRRRGQFLRSLLLHAAAQVGQSVTVRATYPLAFGNAERTRYAQELASACADVGAITGQLLTTLPAAPRLFGDEASVLLATTNWAFDWQVAVGRRIVVQGDLGGGTLDIAVAEVEQERTAILAAESVRFGTGILVELLAQYADKRTAAGAAQAAIQDFVRSGHFLSSAPSGPSHPPPGSKKWSTEDGYKNREWIVETALVYQECQKRLKVYGALLVEYIARVVAGAVIDTHAAGSEANDVTVYFRLSGNGWKTFESQLSCWTREEIATAAHGRIVTLLGATAKVHRLAQSDLALPKSITAESAFKLPPSAAAQQFPGPPDGFDEPAHRWHVRIPSREAVTTATVLQPDVVGAVVELIRTDKPATNFLNSRAPQLVIGQLLPGLRTIQGSEATARGVQSRVVPTLRALFETPEGVRRLVL